MDVVIKYLHYAIDNGNVYAFGDNSYCQLGKCDKFSQRQPVLVDMSACGAMSPVKIACTDYATFVIDCTYYIIVFQEI